MSKHDSVDTGQTGQSGQVKRGSITLLPQITPTSLDAVHVAPILPANCFDESLDFIHNNNV